MLRRFVPYSGSVYPHVLLLEPGHARVEIADRHSSRNHLDSVHAIALANVAELAGGLAMTAALPADVRGIVTAIRIEYLKKARGRLVAESRCTVPAVDQSMSYDVVAEVFDSAEEVVARATVTWLLAPRSS
jgi:acyl-coenzyme A thioesterase PaaI-like protein